MSTNSNSSFGVGDDLLEIRARCKELTKEKEMLKDSKSQSLELIRKLECRVDTLSEARDDDKKYIQQLERELDYLQEQLNTKDSDLNCFSEEVRNLQSKLANMENLEDEVAQLREQMMIYDSERMLLMQEIEDKEVLVRSSTSCIEKLEEATSSMGLEYQCEIESTKLELIALEQSFFETKKLLEEKLQQNSRMKEFIQDLNIQLEDADKVITGLNDQNQDLKRKLEMSDIYTSAFTEKEEELFIESLQNNGCQTLIEDEMSTCSKFLGPIRPTVATSKLEDAKSGDMMAELKHQIDEYENLVRQLKEELRSERLKSKEEAEDLAQEMAELRYQITGLLEEECKRRVSIEQISLQRIAELEAQIAREQQKPVTVQSIVVRNIKET